MRTDSSRQQKSNMNASNKIKISKICIGWIWEGLDNIRKVPNKFHHVPGRVCQATELAESTVGVREKLTGAGTRKVVTIGLSFICIRVSIFYDVAGR